MALVRKTRRNKASGAVRKQRSSLSLRVVFPLLLILFVVGMAELFATIALKTALKRHEFLRNVMTGRALPEDSFQHAIGQAYLLYAPKPGHKDGVGIQHNVHGYRGRLVPLRKAAGVIRILALGGSTTYGWSTPNPDETWPAWLEKLLKPHLPPGATGVEVINGGLPWGTSAELLTHYQFKYRYYKPDIVVINTGGNDAEALIFNYYQPDYSHQRQPMAVMPTLPALGRLMAQSSLLSIVMAEVLYGGTQLDSVFRRPVGLPPVTHWFKGHVPDRVDPRKREIPDDYNAYRQNIETLLSEVEREGAKAVLVAFRAAPGKRNTFTPDLNEAFAWTEETLRSLAQQRRLPFAPFPAEVVSPENWADACHLNGAGNRQKAEHILQYVAPVLREVRLGPVREAR